MTHASKLDSSSSNRLDTTKVSTCMQRGPTTPVPEPPPGL